MKKFFLLPALLATCCQPAFAQAVVIPCEPVTTNGASITWSQSAGVTTQNSSQKTTKALTITGLTSNTDVQMYQRIESYDGAAFAGQQVTMQFTFTNNTSATVTPQILTCFASATDNFATCTADLAAVNMQACTSTSTCTEAYSFPASASASNGYQIKIDFGAMNANTKNVVVSAADARVTPGVATGTIASPPWPELVPIGVELPRDQRYFYGITSAGTNAVALGQCISSTGAVIYVDFPTTMRSLPTGITLAAIADQNLVEATSAQVALTNLTLSTAGLTSVALVATVGSAVMTAGNATILTFNTAAGFIWFTGAEL